MKIKDKISKKLNDTFPDDLLKFLSKKFPDVKFESYYNLFSMRRVTEWDTEDPVICSEIKRTVEAYETAYWDAVTVVNNI